MDIGQLVRATTGRWGTGKVLSLNGTRATVEFFESVAIRHREDFSRVALRRARVYPQTRCYLYDRAAERWAAGRVGQFVDGEYEVHMPDRRTCYVREAELYVRCARVLRDPVEVLIHRAHETGFFHKLRYPFLTGLMRQRTAAGGLAGLISSRITLYPHQVEIARRVLSDPVQRYLLADEVGLGKTIEAGIILRQLLLDRPEARALILVPGHLRGQWRSELEAKFAIGDFPDRVELRSTSEWEAHPIDGFDLAVIDEAHHAAALAHSESAEDQRRFSLYRQLATSTPKLLLLSATPALHHEEAFLALLHLLEPTVYCVGDVELLRQRLVGRQQIGHFLLSFTEGAPTFSLRRGLGRVEELAVGDPHIETLAANLREVLESGEPGDARRRELVREIRAHVADQYRLHRRLLRTRRSTVDGGVTSARQDPACGGGQLVPENDLGDSGAAVHEVLDEWRAAAARSVSLADDDLHGNGFRTVMVALLEAAGAKPKLLHSLVACRLRETDGRTLAADFGDAVVAAVRETPLFEDEEDLLEQLRSRASVDERWELLSAVLRTLAPKKDRWGNPQPRKVLLFTSFPSVREELVTAIRAERGQQVVATYGEGHAPTDVDGEVARFRDDPECWLLVCDSSGEEGRNLQFVDWLIHYDLPFAPNRIEQRIGRVDRIGRDDVVRNRVFVGPECQNSLFQAWFDTLHQGFGVFEKSIADLQFYVDMQVPRLVDALFNDGAQGLRDVLPTMRDGIAEEQRRITEQHALDEIEALDRKSEAYFKNVQAEESRTSQFRSELEGWVCRALHVDAERSASGVVRYQPTRRSLIAPDVLLSRLGQHVGRAGTFMRNLAVESGAALYRVGEPFVDALADYVDWDDRGRAYAIWRCDAALDSRPGTEWSGFRFDFILEPDLSGAEDELNARGVRLDAGALRRRADEYMPPRIRTVYLGTDGQAVSDPDLLRNLDRPYHKLEHGGTDFSITKHRLPLLNEVVDESRWEEVCRSTRGAAEETLLAEPELRAMLGECCENARVGLSRRLTQLERRAALHGLSDRERTALAVETELERCVRDHLVNGIRNPAVRLDSVGFFVLSGRNPLVPRTALE